MSAPGSNPAGWTRIPPPVVFVVPLVVGLWLAHRWPLFEAPAPLATALRWLGVALVVAGAAHTLTSVALFATSRTTVIPHRRSSALVERGAYRWTRNPMYLGFTLAYLGVSLAFGALWPILFLPLAVLVIDRRVIPMEERQLEEAFGQAYRDYKTRVRRWL
jgi:protein-S-isoprenylcysteine O-methyltransferase Ste14